MTTIFFIRHGQTLWNKALKYQGHSDIALTEEGLQQAERVARRLSREPFAAIYSSDLSRAVVTAEKVAEHHALPVVTMPEFREVGFGAWEGLKYDQIYASWSTEIEKFFRSPSQVEIPGGETFHAVKARTDRGIAALRQKHDGECIAVVSHGGLQNTDWASIPRWQGLMAEGLRNAGYDRVIPFNWVAVSNKPGYAAAQGRRLV